MKISESLLSPESRNSKHLKRELAHHLYWRLGYSIVCDEYDFMDVFGINRSGYGVEFEIKVTKADFDREIKIINSPQPEQRWYNKDWVKWEKHAIYLNKDYKREKTHIENLLEAQGIVPPPPFRPNDFYFYVPDYLIDHALPKLQNLPYGLIKIGKVTVEHKDYQTGLPNGESHSYFWRYTVVKKSTKLHTEKPPSSIIFGLAHALTVRSKLLQ